MVIENKTNQNNRERIKDGDPLRTREANLLTKAGVESSPQNSNKNHLSAVKCDVISVSLGLGRNT